MRKEQKEKDQYVKADVEREWKKNQKREEKTNGQQTMKSQRKTRRNQKKVAGAIAAEKKCTKGRKISLYFEFINWNMSALGNVHH